MKKIIKQILFIFSLMLVSFISLTSVHAAKLDFNYQDNIYYVHVNDDGSDYSAYQLSMFKVDGKIAYCIEPGVAIPNTNYNIGDWSVTSLTKEQRERIELIGYYGYEYPSHKNVRYYMAAQELIWKTVYSMTATWSTGPNKTGNIINIEKEKQEILSLIKKHNIKPSFDNITITKLMGDSITLEDKNNILNEYKIYTDGKQDVKINGNTLNIYLKNTGVSQIKLIRKNYDNDINLIYYNQDSQKLAHTRLSDSVMAVLNVKAVVGKIKLQKVDKDTGESIHQGEATLKGAVYDIFDENNNYITSVTTNNNGGATSVNLPKIGRYYLLEKTPSKGYQLDKTKNYFDISLDNLSPTVKVYEKVINRDFEFIKVYASNKTGIMTPEANIEFGIYDSNNKLVKKLNTDSSGKIAFNLPYGKYTLKQLTTKPGYEKLEDYHFEIKDLGEKINKTFANAPITAKLKVVKVDSESGKTIKRSNIKFKIYNIDKKEYVSQKITYPTAKTLDVFETDSNGILITPYALKSGNYRLEEVDQKIDKYLWNKESVLFTIGENAPLYNDKDYGVLAIVKFANTRVLGEVEINKNGEELIIENGTYHYNKIKLNDVVYELFANEDIKSGDGTLIYKKDSLIGTYKTQDGYIKISNLFLGKYYLLEKSTVGEHLLDKTKHEFELKYKDQYTPIVSLNLTFNNYLPKSTLEFTKTDLLTNNSLPNTKIQIFTNKKGKESQLIFEGYTNKNGKIIINNLFSGSFAITETEAPTGYKLSNKTVYFEIKENGKIIKVNMTNEKITSKIKIHKVDENGKDIAGVKIGIFDLNGKLINSYITDKSGFIETELKYGSYYYQELKTIKGYKLNNKKVYFNVTKEGELIESTLVNNKEIVRVPSTGLSNINKKIASSINLIIIGLGLIIYDKYSKKVKN